MKYIQSNILFESVKIPWDFLTELMNHVKGTRNWYRVWELEGYKGFENIGDIHDKVYVKLHNSNIVRKRVKLQWKLVMMLNMIQDMYAGKDNKNDTLNLDKYKSFKEWYYNSIIKIYRGIPMGYDDLDISDIDTSEGTNLFKSFSLNKKTAIKFTDNRWAYGTFTGGDTSERNGYILETEIRPCDIHIFNNEGHEFEIIPSKLNNDIKVSKISNGVD